MKVFDVGGDSWHGFTIVYTVTNVCPLCLFLSVSLSLSCSVSLSLPVPPPPHRFSFFLFCQWEKFGLSLVGAGQNARRGKSRTTHHSASPTSLERLQRFARVASFSAAVGSPT